MLWGIMGICMYREFGTLVVIRFVNEAISSNNYVNEVISSNNYVNEAIYDYDYDLN